MLVAPFFWCGLRSAQDGKHLPAHIADPAIEKTSLIETRDRYILVFADCSCRLVGFLEMVTDWVYHFVILTLIWQLIEPIIRTLEGLEVKLLLLPAVLANIEPGKVIATMHRADIGGTIWFCSSVLVVISLVLVDHVADDWDGQLIKSLLITSLEFFDLTYLQLLVR